MFTLKIMVIWKALGELQDMLCVLIAFDHMIAWERQV